MKYFVIIFSAFAALYFFGSKEEKRYQSLTPEQQYAERCSKASMAVIMAEEFIKRQERLAKSPSHVNWDYSKHLESASDGEDCAFRVVGDFKFENKFGGTSIGAADIVVKPDRSKDGQWLLVSYSFD